MNRAFIGSCQAFSIRRSAATDRPDQARLIEWLRARRAILAGLTLHVQIGDAHRRVMMRNGGGDAIDAVIAALCGALAWRAADHRRIARHPRYPREGKLYV